MSRGAGAWSVDAALALLIAAPLWIAWQCGSGPDDRGCGGWAVLSALLWPLAVFRARALLRSRGASTLALTALAFGPLALLIGYVVASVVWAVAHGGQLLTW